MKTIQEKMPDVTRSTMTQKDLNEYKNLYPNNAKVQAITLEELLSNTQGVSGNWNDPLPQADSVRESHMQMLSVGLSSCQMSIGWVVYDALCLALGAVGLRAGASASTIEGIANAAAPVASKLEAEIAKIAASGASATDKAKGVFNILKIIYNGGSLGAVFAAFTSSLTWWDAALYGVTGIATIIAALATDGIAFAAEVVILLTSFGFLASDSVKAVEACSIS